MTSEQEGTLRAAVRVQLGLHPGDVHDLIRGLPKRHAVEWSLNQAAEFVLREFATGASETTILAIDKYGCRCPQPCEHTRPGADKLREDLP